MSTKFTRSPISGLVLLESKTLRLSQKIDAYRNRQIAWLLKGLKERGFTELSAAHITLIGALDCAENIAAEIARRLNISRQAVHKTVHELERFGYLITIENKKKRNSRVILITAQGERLIATACELFAEMDKILDETVQQGSFDELIAFFDTEL